MHRIFASEERTMQEQIQTGARLERLSNCSSTHPNRHDVSRIGWLLGSQQAGQGASDTIVARPSDNQQE